jgi:hypothetical protein
MGEEDRSGEKRRLELLKQYRTLISRNLRRIKDMEALVGELRWHTEQLEKAGSGFQDCPGAACSSCEFVSLCDFTRDPRLASLRNTE